MLNTVIHDVRHDDIYLNVFPLFHTGGLFTYLSSQVVFGNTTILTKQFDPAQVLDLIEREQVTIFAAVPTMYQLLTQAPNWGSADLSSLRFCTSGGAPLPVPLVEQYTREKGIRFKQGFGMTEYGPGLFALPPEDAHPQGRQHRAPQLLRGRARGGRGEPPARPPSTRRADPQGAFGLLRLLERPRRLGGGAGRGGLVPHGRHCGI